jgi:hypothetical protein
MRTSNTRQRKHQSKKHKAGGSANSNLRQNAGGSARTKSSARNVAGKQIASPGFAGLQEHYDNQNYARQNKQSV